MKFGAKLSAAIKAKKQSMEWLGRGLGTGGKDVTKQTVNGWLKGKHYPKVDQLVLICEKVGMTPDELVLDEQPSMPMKSLNGLEGNLIMMFRMLESDSQRDDALTYMNNLLSKSAKRRTQAAPFLLPAPPKEKV